MLKMSLGPSSLTQTALFISVISVESSLSSSVSVCGGHKYGPLRSPTAGSITWTKGPRSALKYTATFMLWPCFPQALQEMTEDSRDTNADTFLGHKGLL